MSGNPIDRLAVDIDAFLKFIKDLSPRALTFDEQDLVSAHSNSVEASLAPLRDRRDYDDYLLVITGGEDNDPANVERVKLELKLVQLNDQCANSSGMPAYPSYDKSRKQVLSELENFRTLTRWEYICLYEYQAWLNFCSKHGLDENVEFATKNGQRQQDGVPLPTGV